MKKLYILFLLTTIISCSEEYGDKVVGGNLTVYYVNSSDETLATKLALFYRDHNLIADEPHHVQISRRKKGCQLKIIARDKDEVKQMSFKERKALVDLQGMLRDSVFMEKKMDLIICDNQFKPILNINK